jgi:plasmid stabilization system protein ParE
MRHAATHPEADEELTAAALYYEGRGRGLGTDFLEDFEATVARILEAPERRRRIRGENRKLNFHKFPYAVVYSIGEDRIFIKAVMHLRRKPFYWLHRH